MQVYSQTPLVLSKKPTCYNEYKVNQPNSLQRGGSSHCLHYLEESIEEAKKRSGARNVCQR